MNKFTNHNILFGLSALFSMIDWVKKEDNGIINDMEEIKIEIKDLRNDFKKIK